MAFKCDRCHYTSETDQVCPTCETTMHFSLIDEIDPDDDPNLIKVAGDDLPTLSDRFVQWLLGMVWTHVFAYALFATCIIVLVVAGLHPGDFPSEHPLYSLAAEYAIPLIAIVAAIVIALRGVFLAQLAGAVIGGCGIVALLAERSLFNAPAPVYQWTSLPALGAAIGFVIGLRIGGRLELGEEIQFKPIDAWDKATKPQTLFRDLSAQARWARVFRGLGTMVLLHILWLGFYHLFVWVGFMDAHHPRDIWQYLSLDKGAVIAAAIGAFHAGSRTKSGLRQGLKFGLLAALYLVVFNALFKGSPLPTDPTLLTFAVFLILGGAGGWFGSFYVSATKNYIHSEEERIVTGP